MELKIKNLQIDIAEINLKTRKKEIVRKRKTACFQLWANGLKQKDIAQMINITQQAVSFHISHS